MKIKNYKLSGLIFMGIVLAPQAVFARGGSLSQLTAVDTSEQQAALDQKLADVFTDLYDSSQKSFDEFSSSVSQEAASIEGYSQSQMNDYKNFIDDELAVFKESCKAAQNKALLSYLNFISETGSLVDQKVEAAIKSIITYFTDKVTLMTAEMLSGKSSTDIASSLTGTINQFNEQTIKNFENNQQLLSTIYSQTGWESFCNSVEHFMPVLGVQLATDVGTLIIKKVGEFAQKGADLITEEFKKKDEKKDDKKTGESDKKEDTAAKADSDATPATEDAKTTSDSSPATDTPSTETTTTKGA